MHAIVSLAALLFVSAQTDNWPDFRGPAADGHSAAKGLPLQWTDTQNVKWKTPIPGKGWSSPIVWGRQIWLTSATEDGRQMFVYCIDKESGRILHERLLFQNEAPEGINDYNSYASPSCAIEDGRVYAHFGRYGTACIDTKTFEVVWQRRDIVCAHSVGPGSSPILYRDLLILTMDGVDVQFLLALDKRTGKTVWKRDRGTPWSAGETADGKDVRIEERKSFCTPIVAAIGGKDVLLNPGARAFIAYDPRTGEELWRVRHGGYSLAARPVVGDGLIYFFSGYDRAEMFAVRTGARGDSTDTHIAWRQSKNIPYKPTPILIDGLLFVLADSGVMTCTDSKTGEEIWKDRVGVGFSASPLFADGRMYLFSDQGKCVILEPGRSLKLLAENQLPEGCWASPAVSGKALFVRTKGHLYRIESL